MKITRTVEFEAAHQLPYVPAGHKCGRMHGHSYRVEVELEGGIQADGEDRGMVIDFARIDDVVKALDHTTLNEVLQNPTSEELARWIAEQVQRACPQFTHVERVAVAETSRSSAEWTRRTDGLR